MFLLINPNWNIVLIFTVAVLICLLIVVLIYVGQKQKEINEWKDDYNKLHERHSKLLSSAEKVVIENSQYKERLSSDAHVISKYKELTKKSDELIQINEKLILFYKTDFNILRTFITSIYEQIFMEPLPEELINIFKEHDRNATA